MSDMKISTSPSGMIDVVIEAGQLSSTASITPTQALYYADVLKSMATIALKHNSDEETDEDDG